MNGKNKELKEEAIQEAQGLKERKPSRPHDQLRISFKHAGRGNNFRDFKEEKTIYIG